MLVQTLLALVKGIFPISAQQVCDQQGMLEERGKEIRENPLPWQDIICSWYIVPDEACSGGMVEFWLRDLPGQSMTKGERWHSGMYNH